MSEAPAKVIPFKRKAASPFPERALTAAEWRDLITAHMQMHISAEAFDFVSEHLNIDVDAIDEIIRCIGRYGVIGGPDRVK